MYDDEADSEFISKYEPVYRAGNSGGTKTGSKATPTLGQRLEVVGSVDDSPLDVKWYGYDIQKIIDARYAAKLPCADDHNRHKERLKLAHA